MRIASDAVSAIDIGHRYDGAVALRDCSFAVPAGAVAEIQDIRDHVVVLAGGRVRLAAEIEPALERHRIAVGALGDLGALDGHDVVELQREEREFTALVSTVEHGTGPVAWHRPTLDEMVLGYLRADAPQPTEEVHAA